MRDLNIATYGQPYLPVYVSSFKVNIIIVTDSIHFVARLNAAARHRNVYFDSIGGDPYRKFI